MDREGLILAVNDEVIMLGNRFYIKATAILKDIESEGSFRTTAYAREEESKKRWVQHKLPAQHRATRENTR